MELRTFAYQIAKNEIAGILFLFENTCILKVNCETIHFFTL